MAQPTRAARALGLAAILLGLAGCASSTAAPPSSTGGASVPPVGSAGQASQPAASVVDLGAKPTVGTYTNATTPSGSESFTLEDGGKYTMTVTAGPKNGNKALSISGTWTYAVGALRFVETSGGTCGTQAGSYSWSFDGKAVTLGLIADPCTVRSQDFVSGPWTKS